jgi:Transferrin.
VAVFDAGDVYTAGLKYDLIPFISEIYNLGHPEYYAVAVAKEEDPDTELTYLKGRCIVCRLFYTLLPLPVR